MFALWYIPLLVIIVPFLMAMSIPLFHLNKLKKIVACGSIIIISIIGCAINQFFSTTQSCYVINISDDYQLRLSSTPTRKVFVVFESAIQKSLIDGDEKYKSSELENYFKKMGKDSKKNKKKYITLYLDSFFDKENDVKKLAKAYTKFNWTIYLPNGGFFIAKVRHRDPASVKEFFKTSEQLDKDYQKNTRVKIEKSNL
ncbi:hypothetical protein EDEG_00183 [Edhazardia aedis USNM 41457]|uniref:Uncharacterized protein n=1 Tax=Edhazardia aedis (strain USNM 41457) TaxID=1003232 RepID=J9DM72_EDHAE|nr:hypothetical protein EDEG_00183 [Edhazardia aedis USNM 41457]|eukprot:EJW03695.1 hypothetical protein EDEG_00183 [Edhazardia aedis USNM 41457]